MLWIRMPAHTHNLEGTRVRPPKHEFSKKEVDFHILHFLIGFFFPFPPGFLTCLRIQSEFSQPKLSSRILHPRGQKYTHGPSMV